MNSESFLKLKIITRYGGKIKYIIAYYPVGQKFNLFFKKS